MSDNDAFLDAIRAAPNDVSTRLVYADWLDEHGHAGGAFLRAECEWFELQSMKEKWNGALKLQDAGKELDADWLRAVSRVPIESCIQFHYECPKRWELLQVTSDSTVRYCETCETNVYFCQSIAEARTHARSRRCIAVDARVQHYPFLPNTEHRIAMGIFET